jgi:hypothetical protein
MSEQGGEHLGGVADHGDRDRLVRLLGRNGAIDRRIERGCDLVDVPGRQPLRDAVRIDLDGEAHAPVHRDGEWLGTSHAAQTGGERQCAREVSAEALVGDGDEGLVGALEDPLGADVDPRSRRHLTVHHQSGVLEVPEVAPGRPIRHEVRVCDEDPRCRVVGAEAANRLSGLDEQCLVALELGEVPHDRIERIPRPRRLAATPVDDEVERYLGDLGIEVVQETAEGGLLEPTLRVQTRSTRRSDEAWPCAIREGRVVRLPAGPRPTVPARLVDLCPVVVGSLVVAHGSS